MEWFTFLSTHPDQLEVLVNAHIKRGYRLHFVSRNTSRAQVTLVADLPEEEWLAMFAEAKTHANEALEARLAKQPPPPPPPAVAAPKPATGKKR